MNKITLLVFLTVISYSKAQEYPVDLKGKTFVATIGWICEEMEQESDCAGEEIHLVLDFSKEKVNAEQSEVDSCGETLFSETIGMFQWQWAKNKHWGIIIDRETTKGTVLEYTTLLYLDDQLIGRKITAENQLIAEYHFRENKK